MLDKLGKYLGEGFRRIVYEHKDRPDLVIKFLKKLDDDHKKLEFENWKNLKDTERGKWLVPCEYLSEDGRFLFQKKVKVLEIEEAPKEVPEWIKILGDWEFGGNKSKHWGIYQDRIVLIDYGDKVL
jgi:hypothetical protein